MTRTPEILIVDDDVTICVALSRLLRDAGFRVQTFGRAGELLEDGRLNDADCLVLDVHLPDLSGLELQQVLAGRGVTLPVIFLTGHGDIPMSVRAIKAGAAEFLTKPVAADVLLAAIADGLARTAEARLARQDVALLEARYHSLTPREREVFELVVRGLLNKQVAAELGAAERTIKIHRRQVMQKMQAPSLADLVRMAEHLPRPAPKD